MKLYNVSDKSIRNWIEAAKGGDSGLELLQRNGRFYIADTFRNEQIIEKLAERGKKYRNSRSFQRVSPRPDFYKIYAPEQIVDIVNNIEIYRELPHQYRYRDQGAKNWNDYLRQLYESGSNNHLTEAARFADTHKDYFDNLLGSYKSINVIDVGVGNGLAIKEFLTHFHSMGKLNKYIGIDISPELLDITEANIKEWFKNEVKVEKHVRDITHQRFHDLVASEKDDSTVTILFFLGGTVVNFRNPNQPLQTIKDSMGLNDILVSTLKLDHPKSRRHFDFNVDPDRSAPIPLHGKFLLELLNVDEAFYEVEALFDESQKSRFIRARFRVSVSLTVELGHSQKTIEIEKGQSLLIMRATHASSYEITELYAKNGFRMLQAVESPNQEFIMLVNKVKSFNQLF